MPPHTTAAHGTHTHRITGTHKPRCHQKAPLRSLGGGDRRWPCPVLLCVEGKGPQRRLQKRLDGRLEEVAKAVGGGCCRLQKPLRLALGASGTVAGHKLGALEEGGTRRMFKGPKYVWVGRGGGSPSRFPAVCI